MESMSGWEVCGEADNGRAAIEMVGQLKPDIVIMDVTMPELNGLEATRIIKRDYPDTEVLVCSGHESEDMIRQVFEAGARSYIVKTEEQHVFESALRCLANHKSYFTPFVGEVLFNKFLNPKKAGEETPEVGRLTARERQIVQLLAEGKSNKEVGEVLGISVKTAETHRASSMRKLQLKSFSELVRYAIRNHLIAA